MTKRNKFEVVDFTSGGFFIHGGNIGETYFKNKDDADQVCAALNMIERLKLKRTKSRIETLVYDLDQLNKAMSEGTEESY